MDDIESPRRPLQRSPLPSQHLALSQQQQTAAARTSNVKEYSPTRQFRETGSPTRGERVSDSFSLVGGSHYAVELSLMAQRLSSFEERFSKMESLVSRVAARVEMLASQDESDRRDRDAIKIRLDGFDEQSVTVLRVARDASAKVLQLDQRWESVASMMRTSEQASSKVEALQQRIDDTTRAVKRVAEQSDREFSVVRNQLAKATQLLQTYVKRQCDTLSGESLARLEAFEKDRQALVQDCADVSHGIHETRLAMSDIRSAIAEIHTKFAQQDATLHRFEESQKAQSEDVKAVDRRLLSAVRYLSSDPNAFLAPLGQAHHGAAQAVHNGNASPREAYSSDSPSRAHIMPAVSSPAPAADGAIDQFIAELNFMSRNAVM